ncbi:flagellar biosynthetic protein FliO [Neobacillus sp. LXY-4]|uniref:flagellar biosynthetic protein FliO n=1 Tax=Neobacillus sp. LXY-4 TaxID=3379826 RepID=UPI003EE3C756
MKIEQFAKKMTIMLVIILLVSQFHGGKVVIGKAEAATVYDSYTKNSSQKEPDSADSKKIAAEDNTSLAPSFIKFVFSFASIIILLLLLLKYLKSKARQLQSRGPYHSLGAFPLGSNRSLQMLMIGKTLYILGVGEEVRLIRTIDPGEEQDLIIQSLVEEEENKQQGRRLPFKKDTAANHLEKWEHALASQITQTKQTKIPIKNIHDES